MATSIVWGMLFSTTLTLFVVPMLYRAFMPYSYRMRRPPAGEPGQG